MSRTTLLAAFAAILGAVALITSLATRQASSSLIYQCSAQPCAHMQEFTVSDKNRAPVFSVAEAGGAGVFGDNLSIYSPAKGISSPVLVWSYASPQAYGKTSCTPPETWYSPSAIWTCESGKFTRDVKL